MKKIILLLALVATFSAFAAQPKIGTNTVVKATNGAAHDLVITATATPTTAAGQLAVRAADGTMVWSNAPDAYPFPGYSTGQFGGVTNSFYPLGCSIQTATVWGSTGVVLTNGNYRLQPWFSGSGGVLTNLAISIKTATGNVRWGVYESTSFNNLWPSNLVYDSASQVAVAAVMVATPSVTILPRRIYWSVVQASAGCALGVPSSGAGLQTYLPSPSYSTFTNSAAQPVAFEFTPGVFGAFPSVFPAATNNANLIFQTSFNYCVVLVGAFR